MQLIDFYCEREITSWSCAYCPQETGCSFVSHHKLKLSKILEGIKVNFNEKLDEIWKKWGRGIGGIKSQAKTNVKEQLLAKEAAQRMA